MDQNKYSVAALQNFAEQVMVKAGLSKEASVVFADSLLKAEGRGVKSHGLTRLSTYAKRVELGLVAGDVRPVIEEDGKTILKVDGRNGQGSWIGKCVMDLCIERAKEYGSCFASVGGGNHFGYAAFFAEQAAKEDMIGIAIANGPVSVPPTGGIKALVGTNPVAIAVPAGRYRPLVLDMATTAVARGKVLLAQKNGTEIPLGWGTDSQGRPTTDPNAVINGGFMLPMGGPKGYGLSLIIDLLCACLSDADDGQRLGSMFDYTRTQNTGYCFAALNIGKIVNVDAFKRQIDGMFDEIKACPRAEGVSEIFVPGEIEFNNYERAVREGFTLSDAVLADLKKTAEHFGVDFPQAAE